MVPTYQGGIRRRIVTGKVADDLVCASSSELWDCSWLVAGLGFGVTFGSELENCCRGGDLWLGRLQDRIPAGGAPGGECLAEVGPG